MKKINRRKFVRNAVIASAGAIAAPYILPSGRLFAATGSRLVDHVVFVLFAGGIRNQESVKQMYLTNQPNYNTSGNVMENLLTGAAPSNDYIYNPWSKILPNSLASQGALFPEMRYASGPTGHYNGHTVAMTGVYTDTGLNLNINPKSPTIFEYYRKHSDPAKSALNAWWISEGLGPYPSLNYSQDPDYGALYGANYIRPATIFGDLGQKLYSDASYFQPDEVARLEKISTFLNASFEKDVQDLPGIINSRDDKEQIKKFFIDILNGKSPIEYALPPGEPLSELTGDLINVSAAWKVLDQFAPELTVINTFNLDVCHSDFTKHIQFLHKADYGIGWLWDKIQSHPQMANNTVMICMPEHGRNADSNNLVDSRGNFAYDHTGDQNSREIFGLMAGPSSVINQNSSFGTASDPKGESIDIVPTIAHILGFDSAIPSGKLSGRVLNEAFV